MGEASYSGSSKFRAPGFWTGYASVLDWLGKLAPTLRELYGSARTPSEVDVQALQNDWAIVRRAGLDTFKDLEVTRVPDVAAPKTAAEEKVMMRKLYQQMLLKRQLGDTETTLKRQGDLDSHGNELEELTGRT